MILFCVCHHSEYVDWGNVWKLCLKHLKLFVLLKLLESFSAHKFHSNDITFKQTPIMPTINILSLHCSELTKMNVFIDLRISEFLLLVLHHNMVSYWNAHQATVLRSWGRGRISHSWRGWCSLVGFLVTISFHKGRKIKVTNP